MVDLLARNWGWVMLRGVAALIFGLLALFNPAITLIALVILFGAYALVDGAVTIVSAIANRHGEKQWVSILIGGIVSLAAGLVTFFLPAITTLVLLYIIALWAVITGVLEIVAAIRIRKAITGEWLLILAGVLSVLFGILLFARPGAGALAVVLWIGAYAIVFGIVVIALAFRLRHWHREFTSGAAAPAA